VALVNGRHILRSDFITQTQIETAKPFDQTSKEERLKVLSEMLDEELLVQRGLEVDLAASDPDVRAAMVTGVQLQVDADVIAQQPSDEELEKIFRCAQGQIYRRGHHGVARSRRHLRWNHAAGAGHRQGETGGGGFS